jgi:hypothetical protein
MSDTPSIYARLAAVLAQIKRVPKNGRNSFHKYDYVTESDLVDHVRDLLAAEGVCVIPSVVEHTVTGSGKDQITTVTLDITLASDGGQVTGTWIGQGQDNADKGYYKAYTGAMKYFLLKTFLISTGDDPERDEAPAPQRSAGRGGDDRAVYAQLVTALDDAGVSAGERAAYLTYLAQASKVPSAPLIPAATLAKVVDGLTALDAPTRAARIRERIGGTP